MPHNIVQLHGHTGDFIPSSYPTLLLYKYLLAYLFCAISHFGLALASWIFEAMVRHIVDSGALIMT